MNYWLTQDQTFFPVLKEMKNQIHSFIHLPIWFFFFFSFFISKIRENR
jgi:hypothetical protein